MIEFNGKKYYQPIEFIDFINDSTTKISQIWRQKFPKYKQVVLLDQINRVLIIARKERKIKYIKFRKNRSSPRVYYGYAIEDVIEYLENNKDIEIEFKEQ